MTLYRSDNLKLTAAYIEDVPWVGTVIRWPSLGDRERYLRYRRHGYSRVAALRRAGMAIVPDDSPPDLPAGAA